MVKKAQQLTDGLQQIETLTAVFAAKRDKLVDLVSQLESELRAAKKPYLKPIRAAVAEVNDAGAELRAAIEANPAEFTKPRTRTFHGIKVGFRKLVGSITWTSAEQVVALIKRHFADRAAVLIKTTETPVKDALAQLPAADLKRLGVSVGQDTDEVVIKVTGSDVERLVEALLDEEPEMRLKAAS